MAGLTIQLLAGEFATCRLAPTEPVPAWAGSAVFSSVTRNADELSVFCPAAQVPAAVKHERGWRLLKFQGPFDFGAVGILASVLTPLAGARISSLAVATFDTDYLLVKEVTLNATLQALEAAGHTIQRT
ncbi:MAG: ACT domain-containing protein [Opitutae bacterium]|nr:ACT domain-containing protein [Opitutae bacterium]